MCREEPRSVTISLPYFYELRNLLVTQAQRRFQGSMDSMEDCGFRSGCPMRYSDSIGSSALKTFQTLKETQMKNLIEISIEPPMEPPMEPPIEPPIEDRPKLG